MKNGYRSGRHHAGEGLRLGIHYMHGNTAQRCTKGSAQSRAIVSVDPFSGRYEDPNVARLRDFAYSRKKMQMQASQLAGFVCPKCSHSG